LEAFAKMLSPGNIAVPAIMGLETSIAVAGAALDKEVTAPDPAPMKTAVAAAAIAKCCTGNPSASHARRQAFSALMLHGRRGSDAGPKS